MTNHTNAHIIVAMAIETQQESPKHREVQKTPKHVGANGSHDDMVALKVDVAIIKEQCNHFATKEDTAKLETQIAQVRADNKEDVAKLETHIAKLETHIAKLEAHIAEHRAETKQAMAAMDNKIEKAKNEMLYAFNRAAVGMIVFLGGILVTLIIK